VSALEPQAPVPTCPEWTVRDLVTHVGPGHRFTPRRSTRRIVSTFHLFFWVDRWGGEPFIAEPGKCSELVWSEVLALPSDLVDYVVDALAAITRGDSLTLRGW
jgi:hypothetical protein